VIQSALRPLRCRSFEDPLEELDRVGLSRMHFAADQYRPLPPQFLQTAVADLYFTPCVLDSVNTANQFPWSPLLDEYESDDYIFYCKFVSSNY
jgi:hypothetical protein